MKATSSLAFTLACFVVAASAHSVRADGPTAQPSPRPVASLTEGPPIRMGTHLSETDYVSLEARKLRDVPVLWVDYDYLREKGIRVPPQGITPKFRRELGDALGWAIVSPGDAEGAFGPEKRTFWVDFYGGNYTGLNIGGGRTGDVGEVQIKFFGKTPMVFEDGRRGHSDGLGDIPEGMSEAFWGKLNHAELPHGANRAIAVLERRAGRIGEDGQPRYHVLLARDPPSRPAHYFPFRKNSRFARPAKDPYVLAEQIANALPVPPEAANLSLGARIRAGLMTYSAGIGEQHGTAFTLRFDHGSASHSNFELSRRFLDYGTQTAQPGYGRVWLLGWNDRAGELKRTKKFLARDLRRILGWRLPPEIAAELPTLAEVDAEVDRAYAATIRHGFLLHTGAPASAVERLEKSPLGIELGTLLHKVAVEGARNHATWLDYPPEGLTRYDIHAILRDFAEASPSESAGLFRRIPPRMPVARRRELAELYSRFMNEARALAAADGISEDGFSRLVRENARLRSLPRETAYLPAVHSRTREAAERYAASRDPREIERTVEDMLAEASPLHRSGDPYVAVLSQGRNAAQDSRIRLVYDARENATRFEADFRIELGKAWLVADSIPASRPEQIRAFAVGADGLEHSVKVEARDGLLHLRWPATGDGAPSRLRLVDAENRSRELRISRGPSGPLAVEAERAYRLAARCSPRFAHLLPAMRAARPE